MAGLLSTGTDYKNRALSGFARASALESERTRANKTLKTQEEIQKMNMMAMGGVVGGIALSSSAAAGAAMGAWAGPVGVAGGAALGFLFSEMF